MDAPFDLESEAKRLIGFNTVTTQSNSECAVYVGSLFRKLGMQVSYQESRLEGTVFMNVGGLLGGSHPSPILLVTHLDTVSPGDPARWTQSRRDPWKLTVRGRTWYGLGVADTKLDLLCKLLAIGRLDASKLKRPILVLGTFGEESGLKGIARFCQGDWPRPQMAMVGEPTELQLVTRHKGLAVLEVIFRSKGLHRPLRPQWVYEGLFEGKAAHSSTPEYGLNALEASLRFLSGYRAGRKKLAVLAWEGGTGHNVIPDRARLRFSLGEGPKVRFPARKGFRVRAHRLPPGWYPSFPWQEVVWCVETVGRKLLPHQKKRDPSFSPAGLTWNATWLRETREGWKLTMDVRPLPDQSVRRAIHDLEEELWRRLGPPGSFWQFRLERDNPALDLPAAHPLVRFAQSALRSMGRSARTATKVGCSEAGLLKQMGVPSLVFGPGRAAGNIHRPNESIAVAQLKGAIRFYEAFLRRVCL